MPSFDHEVLVELFRNCPELACDLLASCAGIPKQGERAELGSIDLSQVVSVEYRADAVVLLRDLENVITSAIVVEVQRQSDTAKRLSWPLYVTALRARLDAPVVLLVITPDPLVARWARQPIVTGHPGFMLIPIVVEPVDVPRVIEEQRAREAPELAVLSALGHPEIEVARAALAGISALPDELAGLYWDLVLSGLPDQLQKMIGGHVIKNYEYQSEFARKYYGNGLTQGRAEGLTEGRTEGQRSAILRIARARFATVTAEDEERLNTLTLDDLERLVVEVAMVPTYEAFQAQLSTRSKT